jgi:hypothetical protein
LRNRQAKWIEVAPTQQIRENGENHGDDGDEGGGARACSAIEGRNCAFP